MDDFLLDNKELSPSKLLQMKIKEVHENRQIHFPEIRRLQEKVSDLAEKLDDAMKDNEILHDELVLEKERSNKSRDLSES